ncbi:MAG: hypothetical protein V4719_20455 [Planctomycetota bacterium]
MPDAVEKITDFRDGDIIAFYGAEWRSRVISLVTGGGPSHVGIVTDCEVLDRDHGGARSEQVLIESTCLCKRPCLVTGQVFKGVQVQSIKDRIEDYHGKAQVHRLSPRWAKKLQGLGGDLSHDLQECIGTPYDVPGALWSGTRILKYLPWLPHNDQGSVFCSEMIAQSLQGIGFLCVWNPGLFHPASLVNHLVRSGVYLPGRDV